MFKMKKLILVVGIGIIALGSRDYSMVIDSFRALF